MKSQRPKNALTHGLYAGEAVLPWEDADAFAAFRQAIREELNPSGPLEEQLVYDIAELQWRKRRLAFGFLLPYYKTTPPAALLEAAKGGLVELARYLADTKTAGAGTILATGTQIIDYIKARAAGGANTEAKLPPTQPEESSPRSVVDQAYDPSAVERFLKVEAMIDNRVAKALTRLVGLKEYKIIYRTPVSAAEAATALAPPAEETSVDKPSANTEPTRPSGWSVTSD